jgi:hypothetical protein
MYVDMNIVIYSEYESLETNYGDVNLYMRNTKYAREWSGRSA